MFWHMPNSLQSSVVNFELKHGSLSLMIFSRIP